MADTINLGKNSWYHHYTLDNSLKVNDELFEELWALHPEEYGKVKMYSFKSKNYEEISVPRWQQSYGRSYKFTGMTHKALDLTHPYLIKLLAYVNSKEASSSALIFNQVLINWYKDGQHSIGAHSDDERQLNNNSSIYSFSFGQARDFVIKNKGYKLSDPNRSRHVIKLKNNQCVIMGGEMQKHFTHEVPKRSIKTCPNRRINITMRSFK